MKWLLLLTLAFSQPAQQVVNDDNFYGAIYKGMHLVRFTAEWSDDNKQNFYQGKFIVDGDSAHHGCMMMILPSNVPVFSFPCFVGALKHVPPQRVRLA